MIDIVIPTRQGEEIVTKLIRERAYLKAISTQAALIGFLYFIITLERSEREKTTENLN